jgi:hypothetical protein
MAWEHFGSDALDNNIVCPALCMCALRIVDPSQSTQLTRRISPICRCLRIKTKQLMSECRVSRLIDHYTILQCERPLVESNGRMHASRR